MLSFVGSELNFLKLHGLSLVGFSGGVVEFSLNANTAKLLFLSSTLNFSL